MEVFITVLAFIGFDVLTGLIKALAKDGINSTALRKGLYHKMSEILVVIGAFLLEHGAKYINIGVDIPALFGVASYICIMELVSILENLALINPSLDKLFKPFLYKLKEQSEEDKSNE